MTSLLKEINDLDSNFNFTINGWRLEQEEEAEEDNRKIFHTAIDRGGKRYLLDFTPYSPMGYDTFKVFIDFYAQHGKFPTRHDIPGLRGPLIRADVEQLAKTLR